MGLIRIQVKADWLLSEDREDLRLWDGLGLIFVNYREIALNF